MNKAFKIFGILFKFLLILLVILLFVYSLIGSVFRFKLTNKDFYNNIIDENYLDTLTDYIDEKLAVDSSIMGIDYSDLKPIIKRETLKELSLLQMNYYTESLLYGKDIIYVTYPAESFYEITEELVAEKNYEESYLTQMPSDLSINIGNYISSFIYNKTIDVGYKIFSNPIIKFSYDYFYAIIALLLILSAVFVILPIKKAAKNLYLYSGIMFSFSSLLLIPLVLLISDNLPSKLILDLSPFKLFIDNLIYATQSVLQNYLLISVTFFFILLITSIILIVNKRKSDT